MITLAFIRETAHLSDAMVQSYMAAQQIQITRDFAPIWGIEATCVFVPGGSVIPPGAYQVLFQDHSPEVDALGFHTGDGAPVARIFVEDALTDGVNWTVTASHEVLEMLADPEANKVIDVGATEYSVEVCDACEDDQFGYLINGHLMTDFVTPSWFNANLPRLSTASSATNPFTFRGSVYAPFSMADGGYIGERALPNGQWMQQMSSMASPRQVKRPTSRTMRRFNAVKVAEMPAGL
jgi:hypothetical protein